MFCPPRLYQEAVSRSPVPTADPLGQRIQVMLSAGTQWDCLVVRPCDVPCVVKLGPSLRGMAQTQPPLRQKRPPPGEIHLQHPAPSRGASEQGRRPGRLLDCGIWLPRPRHQPLLPLPTSPRFPSCLIRQPLCTTRRQHLPQHPQSEQPPSGLPQPAPGRPGDPGTPSSWT